MSKARDLASKGVITDRSQVLSNKSFSDQITAPSANILTLKIQRQELKPRLSGNMQLLSSVILR